MGTADDAVQAAGASGLSRLLKRKPTSALHYMRAVEPEVERAANAAVVAARDVVSRAEFSIADDQAEQLTQALAELDKANAALAACYEPVTIRALEPKAYEALAALHPSREGEPEAYNSVTFPPELFYAGVQGDLTREQWQEEVEPTMSQGEWLNLLGSAIAVNSRFVGGDIPKG